MDSLYPLIADAVLLTHAVFVAFVVLGLFLIVIGGASNWQWVLNRTFRYLHLGAIAIVVLQAWVGVICPLTTLENWLRGLAGQTSYEGSFVRHWVSWFLYYDAPAWVFTLIYTVFALLVLATWKFWPPISSRKGRPSGS